MNIRPIVTVTVLVNGRPAHSTRASQVFRGQERRADADGPQAPYLP